MVAKDEMSMRERKKRRTRQVVRLMAYELSRTAGYPGTTVEQICDLADISPRTFFRYFPSKAALLIPDNMVEPIIEFFLAAPTEMRPIAAYRYALEQVFCRLGSEEMARQQLLCTLPEAAGPLYNEYTQTIDSITEALAKRLNRSVDDPELRITAGAMTGVLMAALQNTPASPEIMFRGLDFLDAGLPL